MRLKKIKLAGFKSFVDATSIPFPGDMTAVVGPNGCGKSNVIDAVRWVLGESSAKNLRGDSMTDVIFAGSSARKPVSQCSVELVFDNSSGRIAGEYANYNELSVKRVVTKEASSNYLLNGTKCRRRDITDLFLGTGLGPRSYAIIEQGMISKLIESKPHELRVFIEEAAGISKYKERRRETETRIRHTKENLERLGDVRAELGQQLAKLQRQASAAKRYTELKATERTLKAQLAAHRWLKQDSLIAESQGKVSELEVELEKVLAQQTSEETQLIAYREQQADLKQQLSDSQETLFSINNEITKIEQSQLFANKRKQQIQIETEQLKKSQTDANDGLNSLQSQMQETEHKLLELAPETLILDETIEQSEHELGQYQDELISFNHTKLASEQQLQGFQNSLQACNSQIEATKQLQIRTQARIVELEATLAQSNVKEHAQKCAELEQKLHEFNVEYNTQQALAIEAQLTQAKAQTKFENTQCEEQTLKSQWLQADAQLQALLKIQHTASLSTIDEANLDIESIPLWQYLQVVKGKESLVERALYGLDQAFVLLNCSVSSLPDDFWQVKTTHGCYLESEFTHDKVQDSLADCFSNQRIPQELNRIKIASDLTQAKAQYSRLQASESILCETGEWLFIDKVMNGSVQEDGSIARQAQINILKETLITSEQKTNEIKQVLAHELSELDHAKSFALQVKQSVDQLSREVFEVELLLKQLNIKKTELIATQTNCRLEIDKQKELMQLEQEKLNELTEQIDVISIQLLEAEDAQGDNAQERERLESKIDLAREQLSQLVNKKHQIELHSQQVNNQYNLLSEKQKQFTNQLSEANEKLEILCEEAEELSLPIEDQQSRLTQLLDDKQVHSIQQQKTRASIDEVEDALLLIEKGRSGVNQAADKIRAKIESENLLIEGCRVRSQGFLEILSQMQQALKPLLESLPEDIEEATWQHDLEKTQSALSRLGAVNLAAVDEFKQQASRKEHLDTQNDDLTQALETLETAIRKIDKETRSRFKSTFEQVNTDLKMLFPKVFGGGNAYLDLTDDDLLDTGVTIMARPPGKKNSTIHLLSGGEKALTALSLVFAIFRLNPAPFCLLDEVDAPLDDANVGRFCKLVSEMSKTVQFIYITHNKVAMEMATHLTGVTMAEPGVSRMVAVDVEEALAIAE